MQRRFPRLAILLVLVVIAHFVFRETSREATPSVAAGENGPNDSQAANSRALDAERLGPCEVTHVTDGDTLNVRCDRRKERVRMLQIDTPERDDYGRLLAYVFVDDENLNLSMIERGWSPYFDRYGAGAYPREFARAEREARSAKLGIWGLAH